MKLQLRVIICAIIRILREPQTLCLAPLKMRIKPTKQHRES
ncbi:hypothetical protein [Helicobacter cinaedi]|nr:hypothetical protein [Helicobacter cinaedi]